MAGIGFVEVLFVLFTGFGGASADVASLIDPEAYFKSRDVFVGADSMLVLADTEDKTPKEQLARLLALRWLAAHPEDARKAEKDLATLKRIAAGKKGTDPFGFIKEYAERAVAKIEGKPAPASRSMPPGSLRGEALAWFPADATIVGGADLRGGAAPLAGAPMSLSQFLRPPLLPLIVSESLYEFAEHVGNLRVDRLSLALSMDPKKNEPERIYVRISGVGDLKRCAAFAKEKLPTHAVEERKGPKGESITVLNNPMHAPAIAFVGDNDVIIAGFQQDKANHREVIDQMLKVRADGKGSVLDGPLASVLKQLPEKSFYLGVAQLSESMRQQAASQGSPFRVVPQLIAFDASRDKGLAIHLECRLKDAEEAKKFADNAAELKEKGLKRLEDPQVQGIVTPPLVAKLAEALKSIKMEVKDGVVHGRLDVNDETLKMLLDLLKRAVVVGTGGAGFQR